MYLILTDNNLGNNQQSIQILSEGLKHFTNLTTLKMDLSQNSFNLKP